MHTTYAGRLTWVLKSIIATRPSYYIQVDAILWYLGMPTELPSREE